MALTVAVGAGGGFAHGGEVDGAVVLVDLDGVAAAEGDVGAAWSPARWRKMRWSQTSQSARGVPVLISERVVCPEIEGEEGAAHEVGLVGEELEGFGDLDGGGEVDGGGEDAGGVAGVDVAGGGGGEDAGEAGGRRGRGRGRGRCRFFASQRSRLRAERWTSG